MQYNAVMMSSTLASASSSSWNACATFPFGPWVVRHLFYMPLCIGYKTFVNNEVKCETWQRLAGAAWPDLIQAPCQAWPRPAQRGEEGRGWISWFWPSPPPRCHCAAMWLCLGSTPQSTGITKWNIAFPQTSQWGVNVYVYLFHFFVCCCLCSHLTFLYIVFDVLTSVSHHQCLFECKCKNFLVSTKH